MKNTLANRLTYSFTLTVIVSLLVVSLIFGWGFIRFSSQSIQTSQKNIIEVGRAYVERYFNDLLEEITLIAGLVNSQNTSWVSTAEAICQSSKEQYISLAVLEKNGNELVHLENCQAVSEDKLTNRSSEEAFFRAARGELFVGNTSFSEANEPLATISFLTKAQNSLDVVVIARIDLGNIWQPLNELEIGDGGYIYVVDRRGNLVGYRDLELVKQAQSLASLPGVAPLLADQTGVNAANYIGLLDEDVIGSSVLIEKLNWGLVLEQPVNQVYAARNQLGLVSLSVLIAFSVVAVLISLSIARSIVNPIQRLAAGAEAIANENFAATLKVDTEDELGLTAKAFNQMSSRLREFIGTLEERVAARTQDLATVARISTSVATIRDPFHMLETAVHLTQRGFNLYHAHVFTYHKDEDKLQITACGWKEGEEHEGTHGTTSILLSQEQSLVARAARTRQPVIVNDVRSDPGWLPNPLLPDTRAELAIPMIVGDELLGVLDMQADHVDAFTEESANIQMTLAAQLATALQNAQSYTEAQTRAELESLVNTISQKIQRAGTVEETLQTAIRELGTAIGASRVKAVITTHQNTGSNN